MTTPDEFLKTFDLPPNFEPNKDLQPPPPQALAPTTLMVPAPKYYQPKTILSAEAKDRYILENSSKILTTVRGKITMEESSDPMFPTPHFRYAGSKGRSISVRYSSSRGDVFTYTVKRLLVLLALQISDGVEGMQVEIPYRVLIGEQKVVNLCGEQWCCSPKHHRVRRGLRRSI